jgi:hypothetical protein
MSYKPYENYFSQLIRASILSEALALFMGTPGVGAMNPPIQSGANGSTCNTASLFPDHAEFPHDPVDFMIRQFRRSVQVLLDGVTRLPSPAKVSVEIEQYTA